MSSPVSFMMPTISASTLVIDTGLKVIPSCSRATFLALSMPPNFWPHWSTILSMIPWSLIAGASRGRSITPDTATPLAKLLPVYWRTAWVSPIASACSSMGDNPK
ncbi:hypothetical protein D3C77_507060 [compost metagenome]